MASYPTLPIPQQAQSNIIANYQQGEANRAAAEEAKKQSNREERRLKLAENQAGYQKFADWGIGVVTQYDEMEQQDPAQASEFFKGEMNKLYEKLPDGEEKSNLGSILEDDVVSRAEVNRFRAQVYSIKDKFLSPKERENPFGKVSPKDYTQESIDKFQKSGDYADLVAVEPASLVTVNAAAETAADKAYGTKVGERAAQRVTEAEATLTSDASLERAQLALARGANTGFGEETILELKSLGATLFGLEFSESDQEAEIIRKLGSEAALRLRNPESGMGLPGAASNRDLSFLKNAVFGLQRTEGGNVKILDYMLRMNKMKRDVVDVQNRLITSNGGKTPIDLDSKLFGYVSSYEFFSEDERTMIEALSVSNKPVTERVKDQVSGKNKVETYGDGTTVEWN